MQMCLCHCSIREKKGPVSKAAFRIYRVADVTEYGEYVVNDTFKDYPIAFEDLAQEDWLQLAVTLKGYVGKDRIPEFDKGKTDQQGVLTFPSEGVTMKPGLYLVLGDVRTIGSYTYHATPFLICLPGMDADGLQSSYHVDVAPKYRWSYEAPEKPESKAEKMYKKVLKVWNDSGYEAFRPKKITVHLLKDGAVYRTAELSKGNNWRHTWYNLDEKYDWSVVEEEAKGYTVNVSQEGVTFVVTNTYNPDNPYNPNDPNHPNNPESPKNPDTPSKPGSYGDHSRPEKLPQTGQLWWPVPVLVCLGLVCMVIGVLRRRSAYEEE